MDGGADEAAGRLGLRGGSAQRVVSPAATSGHARDRFSQRAWGLRRQVGDVATVCNEGEAARALPYKLLNSRINIASNPYDLYRDNSVTDLECHKAIYLNSQLPLLKCRIPLLIFIDINDGT